LTGPECLDHSGKVRLKGGDLLKGRHVDGLKRTAIFSYRSRMRNADVISRLLTQCLGDFSWAVLWACGLPLGGDRSQEAVPPDDWRRYAQWRRTAGEARALYDAPGHKFEQGECAEASTAIEFALYLGWDAVIFGCRLRSLIRLSHDDLFQVMVHSREELSALSTQLTQIGLSVQAFDWPAG
jgi:hypothetical protein